MNFLLVLFLAVVPKSVIGLRRIVDGCIINCPALYAPVCGSDDKTYNNLCELTGVAVCKDSGVTKVKDRPCGVGNVIMVDSYEWAIDAPKVKIDAKSAININVIAQIARQSDAISGKNLWRVGIFGSRYVDGYGDRVGFKSQILTTKQASKRPKKGKPLKIKNIRSRFDISQIGCGELRYFCVELAKNPDSTVDFELRAGIMLDSIVTCQELECRRPSPEEEELPPTCLQACPSPQRAGGPVCGSDGQQYESLCELTKQALCHGVEVEIDYPGECLPEAIVSGMYWTANARTNVDNPRLSLLSIQFLLFNDNTGVNIEGTNLWQVSLFGSENDQGEGVRHANLEQVLDPSISSTTLVGGFPFQLEFSVPYNTSAVGCGNVRYFCLEIKRNPETSTRFILRRTSGERTIISCREVPCIPPKDKKLLFFNNIRWNVAADFFRFDEPSDLILNVSVEVAPNSEEILGGKNLWRIGVYGSRYENGDEDEKLGFNQQVLGASDSLHSPDIVPGRTLVFPLTSFQFDISAIGCGDYQYLCVVLAKGPNAKPDFEITNNANKRKVVSCRRIQCIRREVLPPPPPTALLSYLSWNLTIKAIRPDGGYNVSVAVNVVPDADTDTIRGNDLWRIGIFLSNASSGIMAMSQYQPDILDERNKAIPLVSGENLLFTELPAVLNTAGVGCPGATLQFVCIEFARGENPTPTFHLPLGPSNAAHSCRPLFCQQT